MINNLDRKHKLLVEDQAALDEDEVSPDNAIPVDPIWSEVERVSVIHRVTTDHSR